MQEVYTLQNLEASQKFARDFAADLLAADADSTLLLFRAGMGAGKTTLTRMIAAELGVEGRITSPTFVGLSEYEQPGLYFAHLDLYQVKFSAEDILDLLLGREDSNAKRFVFIEWSENFDEGLLSNLAQREGLRIIECEIDIAEDESRLLKLGIRY